MARIQVRRIQHPWAGSLRIRRFPASLDSCPANRGFGGCPSAGSLVIRVFLPFHTLSDAESVSRLRIVLDNATQYQQRVIVCLTDHFERSNFSTGRLPRPPDYRPTCTSTSTTIRSLTRTFTARLYRGPFLAYVRKVVTAFSNHPAVFAWELTNEGSNYPITDGFINFCNSMVGEIRAIRPQSPDHRRHCLDRGDPIQK